MKTVILTALMVGILTFYVGTSARAQQDSVKSKGKDTNYGLGISIGKDKKDSTTANSASKGRFIGGITFTRFDLGFTKLVDNGNFNLSPTNDFLDYRSWKTSNVSFDVIQMGYRFNPNFKIYIAGGFDWTLIRLRKNITIQKDRPTSTYVNEPITFSKNRFSSSYFHIPLNFEFRTKESNKGRRFYVVIGPEIGFLINGKIKQISEEYGKVKAYDDYNFSEFRYGGILRLGTNGLAVFAKYYANDMFDSAPQKGLKNMAFGLTFGLN